MTCQSACHSAADCDSLLAFSAALLSHNNQNGDVCVELDQYHDRPLFSSDKIAADDMPVGIEPEQWQQSLLESSCVGTAGNQAPLILEGKRLYLNRYWHYESRVAEFIHSRLEPLPDIDPNKLSHQLSECSAMKLAKK